MLSPHRHGPWALVAGASEGLGAAFATALARAGLNVVLIARRAAPLEALAAELAAMGVEARAVAMDLAAPDLVARLEEATAGLDLGLIVYNAAFAPIGPFLERPLDDLLAVVDVNVRGPVVALRTLAPRLVARGRGGVVLMSSLAGQQGGARLATYAASKAFNTVLGEGLWHELRSAGVDVVAVSAGAVRTPGFEGASRGEPAGTLDAADVAEAALAGLGRGPRVVPGAVNRIAAFALSLLPRRAAVALLAAQTKDLQ
jgi:short-subunit dehydrogenase